MRRTDREIKRQHTNTKQKAWGAKAAAWGQHKKREHGAAAFAEWGNCRGRVGAPASHTEQARERAFGGLWETWGEEPAAGGWQGNQPPPRPPKQIEVQRKKRQWGAGVLGSGTARGGGGRGVEMKCLKKSPWGARKGSGGSRRFVGSVGRRRRRQMAAA